MSTNILEKAKARLEGPVVPLTTPIREDGMVDYEQPFFEVMIEYGWHECLHAALKIFGLPAGSLRLPLVEPPKSHVEKMKKAFIEIGLLK